MMNSSEIHEVYCFYYPNAAGHIAFYLSHYRFTLLLNLIGDWGFHFLEWRGQGSKFNRNAEKWLYAGNLGETSSRWPDCSLQERFSLISLFPRPLLSRHRIIGVTTLPCWVPWNLQCQIPFANTYLYFYLWSSPALSPI